MSTQNRRDDVPTKNGVFQGRLYECHVCGLTLRKRDAVWQRGGWVHRESCYDEPAHKQANNRYKSQ